MRTIKSRMGYGEGDSSPIRELFESTATTAASTTTSTTTTSELCMLLSQLEVQNLLMAHDELASRYETLSAEQRAANLAFMTVHQQQQQQDEEVDDDVDGCGGAENKTLEMLDDSVDIGQDEQQQQHEEEEAEEENDDDDEEDDEEDNALLSEEGKYLLAKAHHYAVDNLKLVNIEKPGAPLGATIRSRDGSIVIGRILMGGAAEQSGLLHEEDEILEINSIAVRGKTINDVCDMIVSCLTCFFCLI